MTATILSKPRLSGHEEQRTPVRMAWFAIVATLSGLSR